VRAYHWLESQTLRALPLLALLSLSVTACQSKHAKALLAAKQAKLAVSSGDHTAARAAAARGRELMQGMPTATEQDEAGRVHDFAPAQNRE
jgi:hypothetical protein